uniref:RRM domain-containing protein n=1 Tax=Romanomermis culicivorax TaxID=13658 RepID=A0A915KME0_ROMCU
NEPLLPNHSHSNGNVVTHNAPPQPLLANRDVVPAAVASIDPAVVAALGPPGAVCFLHNLPPRITLEEICALFPFDARLIEDSVRMHYSHQTGEPTGDCLLAFQ